MSKKNEVYVVMDGDTPVCACWTEKRMFREFEKVDSQTACAGFVIVPLVGKKNPHEKKKLI